jgi:hypothetical protein
VNKRQQQAFSFIEQHASATMVEAEPAAAYEQFQASVSYTANPTEGLVSGLASVFDSTAYGAKGPTRFRRGAFNESLSRNGGKFPFLWQHDASRPIGVVTSMAETSEGLSFTARISKTTLGNDVRELLKDGAITGVSIGFDAVPNSVTYEKHGNEQVRFVGAANLHELSVVTFPADKKARVLTVHKAGQPDETVASMLHESFDEEQRGYLSAMLNALLDPSATDGEELAGRMFSETNLTRMKDALAALVELVSRADPAHVAGVASAIQVPKDLKFYGEGQAEADEEREAASKAVQQAVQETMSLLIAAEVEAQARGLDVKPSFETLAASAVVETHADDDEEDDDDPKADAADDEETCPDCGKPMDECECDEDEDEEDEDEDGGEGHMNPYHDKGSGRFTTKGGGGGGTITVVPAAKLGAGREAVLTKAGFKKDAKGNYVAADNDKAQYAATVATQGTLHDIKINPGKAAGGSAPPVVGSSSGPSWAKRPLYSRYTEAGNPHPDSVSTEIGSLKSWHTFAGGTSAAAGKHSYQYPLTNRHGEHVGDYHISPFTTKTGRHAGYSLKFTDKEARLGKGLWHDVGTFRSPQKAAKAALSHADSNGAKWNSPPYNRFS